METTKLDLLDFFVLLLNIFHSNPLIWSLFDIGNII